MRIFATSKTGSKTPQKHETLLLIRKNKPRKVD